MATLTATKTPAQTLRLQLFELGIELTPLEMDFFISKARRETKKRLAHAAVLEGLCEKPLKTFCPIAFLSALKNHCQQKNPASRFWAWHQFAEELSESSNNLALFYAYQYHWQQQLKKEAASSLWQYARSKLSTEQQTIFFEQWGSEGHPYHPNTKAKMGFGLRDVLAYSPEFEAIFDIHWLAIDKRHASPSHDTYAKFLRNTFAEAMGKWCDALHAKGLACRDFYPLPVHPWQLTHKIKPTFKEFFDEGILIETGATMPVTPTMSYRTVVPLEASAPHIKLATAVHTTSAMRTVSPGSVKNGGKLSALFEHILDKEEHFSSTLYVLKDLGGVHAEHSEGKHLSALLRQNPSTYLQDGETAVVLAALFSRSSVTNKPLIAEIVDASGLSAKEYLKDYSHNLLKGQMTLYLKYGVALEAHQQNTFMVFDKSHRAIKHLNRDLGGIRIYRAMLKRLGILVTIDKSVMIDTDDFTEVRNKFIHANLQSNLQYVVRALATHVKGESEASLWAVVRDVMLAILSELRAEIGDELYQKESYALLVEPWQLKSLLRMRLEPCNGNYLYKTIRNPLVVTEC